MKTVKTILVLLVVMMLASSAFAEGDLLAEIQARGTIIIATEGNWSPWTYHDEDDKLVGLDIEIGTLIAHGLGVEPEFQETDWDSILAGVDSGRFDIACNGVGYNETRAEKYSFSTPYMVSEMVLVVRIDNDEIKSYEDLKGKKTANTISSNYATKAQAYGAEVTGVDALIDTIHLVEQGRVDATLNADVAIHDYLKEHPDAQIKIAATQDGEKCCIPVRKSAEAATLVAAIDEALQTLRENGKLAELSKKYFDGMDLTGYTPAAE